MTAELPAEQRAARHIEALRATAAAAPDDVVGWRNLGAALGWFQRQDEAERILRHALTVAPDDAATRMFLGMTLLALGRYAEAWPLYRARHAVAEINLAAPKGLPYPPWRGEPLAGRRILVAPEQGLGDQLMFARFVPPLVRAGAEVCLLALPPLERLFRTAFPDIEVIAASGPVKLPRVDCWATLVDLAGGLGATLETLPPPPYLAAPAGGAAVSAGFTIGLVTRGGPTGTNDGRRSLKPEAAARLRAALPGTVIDLHPDATGATSFAETAALVAPLDLVVSVDTSAAHLAGAMDKPCMVLIPGLQTDWRWMLGRADSAWYPRHRLYRNGLDGDWTAALDRIVADATAMAGG